MHAYNNAAMLYSWQLWCWSIKSNDNLILFKFYSYILYFSTCVQIPLFVWLHNTGYVIHIWCASRDISAMIFQVVVHFRGRYKIQVMNTVHSIRYAHMVSQSFFMVISQVLGTYFYSSESFHWQPGIPTIKKIAIMKFIDDSRDITAKLHGFTHMPQLSRWFWWESNLKISFLYEMIDQKRYMAEVQQGRF